MIITKTPYRLSFFGGGTDYNSWYEKNGGLIIGCSMAHYCHITVRRLQPFFEHKSRVVYSNIEKVLDNSEIQHPSVHACLKYLKIADGLEIHTDGDLPARSGIGSSSSFTSGMLLALHALRSEMLTKRALALETIKVEQEVIGESVGIQDQILATYGGLQVIDMGPGPDFRVSPLIVSREYKQSLESHVMLGFTGFTRTASDLAKEQIESIKVGKTDAQLSEIHDIAKEGLDLFSRQKGMHEIGKLLDRTWKLKRSISANISSSFVDDLYKNAIDAGAYGGRMMGAGGGGFMVFLAPPERHAQIRQKLQGAIKVWVPFKFDNDGSQVIFHQDSREA